MKTTPPMLPAIRPRRDAGTRQDLIPSMRLSPTRLRISSLPCPGNRGLRGRVNQQCRLGSEKLYYYDDQWESCPGQAVSQHMGLGMLALVVRTRLMNREEYGERPRIAGIAVQILRMRCRSERHPPESDIFVKLSSANGWINACGVTLPLPVFNPRQTSPAGSDSCPP